MRTVFFGNGPVALTVLQWMRERGDDIVGLVLNAPERQSHAAELQHAAGIGADRVFDASSLGDPATARAITTLKPDTGLSVLFGAILRPAILDLFPRGLLNIHPGYLPYNRGRSAQVWGILEGTPVGATLHYMDAGVDTGPIVERIEVPISPADTGETLREKLEAACVDVARKGWPRIADGTAAGEPQDASQATSHRLGDLEAVREIDLDATYTGRELIDRLRALTSPPQSPGAYFDLDGKRILIRVELEEQG